MAEDTAEARPSVEIQWDYTAFPVWSEVAVDALSPGLRRDLQAWSDGLTVLMAEAVGSRNQPDAVALAERVDEGRALARRVATALGPRWDVWYYDEIGCRHERVQPCG